jgi:chromatin structure-remodeling complex subunit RSC9
MSALGPWLINQYMRSRLRACFEEHPSSEITQIRIWQAYQQHFGSFPLAEPILPAQDFIKHVTAVFPAADARVVPTAEGHKFIILGIRWRKTPMDPDGRVYERCQWRRVGADGECGVFLPSLRAVWEHVLGEHLSYVSVDESRWRATAPQDHRYRCCWGTCQRFAPDGTAKASEMTAHLWLHFSDDGRPRGGRPAKATDAPPRVFSYCDTPVDERNMATGVPLAAIRVLTNLAQHALELGPHEGVGGWLYRAFATHRRTIFDVLTCNRTLREDTLPLLSHLSDCDRRFREATEGENPASSATATD